jgi:nitrate/nitrite-specific signal transduction histidine kinase
VSPTLFGNLSEATKRLSSGDFSYRVPVKNKDEIGDLSASFNHMAEQLEEQRQEIERDQQKLEALNNELKTINRNYMEMTPTSSLLRLCLSSVRSSSPRGLCRTQILSLKLMMKASRSNLPLNSLIR